MAEFGVMVMVGDLELCLWLKFLIPNFDAPFLTGDRF